MLRHHTSRTSRFRGGTKWQSLLLRNHRAGVSSTGRSIPHHWHAQGKPISLGLYRRTSAFSSQGDFLTFMNNTTDQGGQLANGSFLREQLAVLLASWSLAAAAKPIQIKYESPANMNPEDPRYPSDRRNF